MFHSNAVTVSAICQIYEKRKKLILKAQNEKTRKMNENFVRQEAQLSQRDRAALCVNFGQK